MARRNQNCQDCANNEQGNFPSPHAQSPTMTTTELEILTRAQFQFVRPAPHGSPRTISNVDRATECRNRNSYKDQRKETYSMQAAHIHQHQSLKVSTPIDSSTTLLDTAVLVTYITPSNPFNHAVSSNLLSIVNSTLCQGISYHTKEKSFMGYCHMHHSRSDRCIYRPDQTMGFR